LTVFWVFACYTTSSYVREGEIEIEKTY